MRMSTTAPALMTAEGVTGSDSMTIIATPTRKIKGITIPTSSTPTEIELTNTQATMETKRTLLLTGTSLSASTASTSLGELVMALDLALVLQLYPPSVC